MDSIPDDTFPPTIKFRPTKKRKFIRQRSDPDHHHDNNNITSPEQLVAPQLPSADSVDAQNEESAVTAAIRARTMRKARLRGVGFGTDSQADDHAATSTSLTKREDNKAAMVKGIPNRFMHQTGLVSTLNDRHMNEYIESRLSSRADSGPIQPDQAPNTAAPTDNLPRFGVQPTQHGKLVEVDLPSSIANPKKTNKTEDSQAPAPRRRNRRGSDDIKRDQLVEAFLHENKLDVYDVPAQNSSTITPAGDDRSADDRMAEEFRQRYLDDVAARRQRKKPPVQPTRQQQQQAADVLKGPKLGGSRNQRAAVRDILLKQEKEKLGKRF
ncbi:hypothetical protein QQS21_011668 [Conoideocrella luteorostrata]|uniref:mRNA splicing factor RNA helicase n=1 Tax=Conoideocrella luteorostrata TaxID=1105319 RepID=A0AAJ0CCV9_9HYPO|nr:hypothetical protein QQS21_011668 [Conoideocrella luteorostrata]